MASVSSRKDRLFAVGMLILSLGLAIQSFSYPAESAQFPRFLSVLLVLLSALLTIREVRALRAAAEGAPAPDEGAAAPPRAGARIGALLTSPETFVFASTALCVLAIQGLGFLAGSVAFMLACAFFLGNRRWVTVLAWGFAFPAALYLLFHSVLGLALPTGWLM